MPSKHEGDVDVTDLALANHFHCPSKQIAVFICAGGVVKEPLDPGMLLRYTLPVGQEKGDGVVGVLRSDTLVEEVQSTFIIPMVNDTEDVV